MKIAGRHYRTIWACDDETVAIIDQTKLPHRFEIVRLTSLEAAADAIRNMQVRGAPLIGVAAAYGVCLALTRDPSDAALDAALATLLATRPTAVNLQYAIERMKRALEGTPIPKRKAVAWRSAALLAEEDVATCQAIGEHGVALLREAAGRKGAGARLNVLTHCNAGWLACVDWGTALAPIYRAHDEGIPVHVYVDETRPRNQGASLTAYELGAHGVPHTLLADNAGGHMMQHGAVDLCIVGSDRTTRRGDVANKIGTYLKALAAKDNGIPFYVALPSSTIDWTKEDGLREIPIEMRDSAEVTHMTGRDVAGVVTTVSIAPLGCVAENPAFDVTPARLVTALVTERGVSTASLEGLRRLYPEASYE